MTDTVTVMIAMMVVMAIMVWSSHGNLTYGNNGNDGNNGASRDGVFAKRGQVTGYVRR